MKTTDDAQDPDDGPTSIEGIARAAATWLRHQRIHLGRHYVAVSDHDPAPWATRSLGDAPPSARRDAAFPPHADGEGRVAPSRPTPQPLRHGETQDARGVTGNAVRASLPMLDSAGAKLEYLRTRNVGDCQRCGLARTRRHVVFGVGDPAAKLMFVGEAPGADEDERGEPFVGAAGRRLDQWLETLGIARGSVYIANVLKCRPPRNRDPEPDEIAKCSPFLHAQIRAIQPRVVVALGRFAAQQLLGREGSLASMRGAGREYVEPKSGARIPVVVTYHPSYVLRRESEPSASQGDASRKCENDVVLEDLRLALAHVERA